MAEHVSRPRGEFREDLQPLMSFAAGCRQNPSSDLRHRHQPSGKIAGNGNNAPLAGFRPWSRNFDELLLAGQMHVLPNPAPRGRCSGAQRAILGQFLRRRSQFVGASAFRSAAPASNLAVLNGIEPVFLGNGRVHLF